MNPKFVVGEDGEFNYNVLKSGLVKRFVSIKECFYHYCMNDGLVQHVSVNEQKLASHVMRKNIYIENPDNVYALWDHIWVNYDFIKNIIAAD